MDEYENFAELNKVEREGVDFAVCVVRRPGASVVVVAPHGGRIEPGTSEVTRQIAGADLSLAIFEGTKRTGNGRLHITSTNFDEPRCLELVQCSDIVVAIHGEDSNEIAVFVGGRDKELGAKVRGALQTHGYDVRDPKKPSLQGLSIANICNRGRRGVGIQLELSYGLRKTFFESLKPKGRRKPTAELATFAGAVREGLRAVGAL